MKTKFLTLTAILFTVMMFSGCADNSSKASGSVDTQNGIDSNIEVEVGQ